MVELIEKGDAAAIYAEKGLAEICEELMKYKLADHREGRIFITEKGNEARLRGLQMDIEQLKIEEEVFLKVI